MTDQNYRTEALKIVETHPNIVGCVAQNKVPANVLLFTPGVNIRSKVDNKGQQNNTTEHVFKNLHTDFVIVGRGIYKAENVEKSAKLYKLESWNAYLKSL